MDPRPPTQASEIDLAETVTRQASHYVDYLKGESAMEWSFRLASGGAHELRFAFSNQWGDDVHVNVQASGPKFDVEAAVGPTEHRMTLSADGLKDPSTLLGWTLPILVGEHKARTASRAGIVARRIYASLPRGLRLANLFTKLALDLSIDGFGRAVYAEFLRKGIGGMPDIHGKPVAEAVNTNSPNLASSLPSGYGASFATKCYKMLLSMGIPPKAVEDLLQDFLIGLLTDSKVEAGRDIHEAEAFVLRGLRMFAMTKRRSMQRALRRESPTLVQEDDDHDVQRDVKDEGIFDALNNMVSDNYMRQMIDYLDKQLKSRVGEDVIPTYFTLSLDEGVDDKRMIMDGRLPLTKFNSVSGWNNFKVRFLYPAVMEYFADHPPTEDYEKRLDRFLEKR